jgi:hypothetical protein
MSHVGFIEMPNGVRLPELGLGTWLASIFHKNPPKSALFRQPITAN